MKQYENTIYTFETYYRMPPVALLFQGTSAEKNQNYREAHLYLDNLMIFILRTFLCMDKLCTCRLFCIFIKIFYSFSDIDVLIILR